MRTSQHLLAVASALLLAACGQQSSMDEAMKRDLEAASAGSIELAPKSGTPLMTAAEIVPQAKPVVNKTRRAPSPAPAPERRTPHVAPTRDDPVATRPASTPQVSPPPPGGYKTIGEVIRNAPFPIKP